MADVEVSLDMPAQPAAVWAVLADFAAISAWAPDVDHSCLLSDHTEGIGMVRRIQTGRTTLRETVTDWEPGESLRYTITGLPPAIRSFTNEWSLAPTGSGTNVTVTTTVDTGPRPPQQAAARLIARRISKTTTGMLAGLAEHLTTAQGSTPL